MSVERAGTLPLESEQHIVATRQTVRSLCQLLKFSLVEQTKMITAASELSRNTLIHGGGGRMRWEVLEAGAKTGLALHFEDDGPGIADMKLAMTDGWTSGVAWDWACRAASAWSATLRWILRLEKALA